MIIADENIDLKETEAMRLVLTKLLSERLIDLIGCFTTVTIQKIRTRRIE